MTLLSALIDLCEADLADSGNATWSASDVEQWCRDAIADYSLHFPRIKQQDITTVLNDRQYDLNADFRTALEVEYPQGEDPPDFLKPRSQYHPSFWSEDGFYSVYFHNDEADPDELLISTKPAADETIRVKYQTVHDNSIATNVAITVPDEHHHILRSYVLWRAALQLKAIEEASPTSNSSLLMSQYAINVDRARRAYVDALAKAVYADSKSGQVSWQDQAEETTRIY